MPDSARNRSSRRGITMVELTVVLVILLAAVSVLGRTMLATARQRVMHRETALAAEAARGAMERIADTEFAERFASYNADPDDDPGGAGTAPGERFAVAGLPPLPGAPGGLQGSVVLPVVNGGTEAEPDLQLREDVDDATLNMPRDLNGDFRIDGLDHADDYLRLPVEVRVEWQGRAGPQTYRLVTQMVELRR